MSDSPIISALLDYVTAECRAVDVEQAYRDILDDSGTVEVAGLTFSPSEIVEKLDATAFRCGCADYSDSQPWTEVRGEYYRDDELDAAKEEFLDEKRAALAEAELGLSVEENLDPGETVNHETVADLTAQIARLTAEIDELEAHAF